MHSKWRITYVEGPTAGDLPQLTEERISAIQQKLAHFDSPDRVRTHQIVFGDDLLIAHVLCEEVEAPFPHRRPGIHSASKDNRRSRTQIPFHHLLFVGDLTTLDRKQLRACE